MAKTNGKGQRCPFCRRGDVSFRALVAAARGLICEHCVLRGLVTVVSVDHVSPECWLSSADEVSCQTCLFCEKKCLTRRCFSRDKWVICVECLCATQKVLDAQYWNVGKEPPRLPLPADVVSDSLANLALTVTLSGFSCGRPVVARVVEPVERGYRVAVRGPVNADGETHLVRGVVRTSTALDVGQDISVTAVGVHNGEVLLSTFSPRGLPDKF